MTLTQEFSDNTTLIAKGVGVFEYNGSLFEYKFDSNLIPDANVGLTEMTTFDESIMYKLYYEEYYGPRGICHGYLEGEITYLEVTPVSNNRCTKIMMIKRPDGTTYHYAIEQNVYEEKGVIITHIFESENMTDDEFLAIVNQTFNTTVLK